MLSISFSITRSLFSINLFPFYTFFPRSGRLNMHGKLYYVVCECAYEYPIPLPYISQLLERFDRVTTTATAPTTISSKATALTPCIKQSSRKLKRNEKNKLIDGSKAYFRSFIQTHARTTRQLVTFASVPPSNCANDEHSNMM